MGNRPLRDGKSKCSALSFGLAGYDRAKFKPFQYYSGRSGVLGLTIIRNGRRRCLHIELLNICE